MANNDSRLKLYRIGATLDRESIADTKNEIIDLVRFIQKEFDRVWRLTEDEARVFVADTARDGHDVMFCQPIGGQDGKAEGAAVKCKGPEIPPGPVACKSRLLSA